MKQVQIKEWFLKQKGVADKKDSWFKIIRETSKAYQLETNLWKGGWCPKSCVSEIREESNEKEEQTHVKTKQASNNKYFKRIKGLNHTSIIFESIQDVVMFNRTQERTDFYKSYHTSDEENDKRTKFTNTKSYSEAEQLLLHGWDEMSVKLTKALKTVNTGFKQRNKNAYSVAGYQACVPRYLQGIPDSMIYSKRVNVKEKVVDVIKDFGYNASTDTETIFKESVKVLKLVQSLESKGYRVNLYICFVEGHKYNNYINMQIKIKNSSQKLNIKQVAFPLVHPSMFRRIMFGTIERLDETKDCGYGYGRCTEYNETKNVFKNKIFIPRIVDEDEITDIEKYRVK